MMNVFSVRKPRRWWEGVRRDAQFSIHRERRLKIVGMANVTWWGDNEGWNWQRQKRLYLCYFQTQDPSHSLSWRSWEKQKCHRIKAMKINWETGIIELLYQTNSKLIKSLSSVLYKQHHFPQNQLSSPSLNKIASEKNKILKNRAEEESFMNSYANESKESNKIQFSPFISDFHHFHYILPEPFTPRCKLMESPFFGLFHIHYAPHLLHSTFFTAG